MAVVEDIARLVFETVGTEAIDDLKENLAYTKLGLQQLQSAYQAGNVSTADYFTMTKKLTGSIVEMQGHLDGLEKAQREAALASQVVVVSEEEYLRALIKTDAAIAKKTGTVEKSTKSQANLRQSIQAGSYAFQDFTATSGDLGAKLNSISNNLPQLLVGLGGLGQAISIGATVAIALYRNWDQVTRLFESKNPFPATAKTVKEMKDEVEKAKNEMEKLETNTSLTKSEMEKYASLRQTIADTEAKITKEEEKQAAIQKFKEIKNPGHEDVKKWVKDGLEGIGGDKDQLAKAVTEYLKGTLREKEKAYYKAVDEVNKTDGAEQVAAREKLKAAKKEVDRLGNPEKLEEYRKEGLEIVSRAFNEGDVGSYNVLSNAALSQRDMVTDEQRAFIRDASPDVQKEIIEEERQEAREEAVRKARDESRQITREAQKKRQAKEANKIRDEVDTMFKGGDFAESSADLLEKIKKSGGKMDVAGKERETKTAEQQYDVLKDMIRAQVEEKLKVKGIDLTGQDKLLDESAAKLSGNAQAKLKQDEKLDKRHAEQNEAARRKGDKGSVHDYLEQEDAQIKAQGLEEVAKSTYAKIVANGGYEDEYGRRYQAKNADQARKLTQQLMERYMHRQTGVDQFGRKQFANPGLDRQSTEDIATKVSLEAQEATKQQYNMLIGKGFSSQQAMYQVLLETQQIASIFLNQLQGIRTQQNRAERNNADLWQAINMGQTNLNGGRR